MNIPAYRACCISAGIFIPVPERQAMESPVRRIPPSSLPSPHPLRSATTRASWISFANAMHLFPAQTPPDDFKLEPIRLGSSRRVLRVQKVDGSQEPLVTSGNTSKCHSPLYQALFRDLDNVVLCSTDFSAA
ncbi:hypothetical protein D9757_011040 [Collybiopsis confluens]|uniref:Uncharacterized protein n=1 Tax=Collybiopsis confluens TaxID=2823264 RepID=A0A8H5GJ57_9AGAR|nr:hypothetical protein D9757_011040 [Collybiopsis confluens]